MTPKGDPTSNLLMIRYATWLFLSLASMNAYAQRGRAFVSVEAHVAASRFVHVGAIKSLELTEIPAKEGRTAPTMHGKPYRLVFETTETIRGAKSKTVELLLDLQYAHDLEHLLENKTELLLVGSPSDQDEDAKVGYRETENGFERERYSLRPLRKLPTTKPGDTQSIEWQLNTTFNSGRMFCLDFTVARSREAVLKKARAFARTHPEVLPTFWIIVPNEFGVQCGYTNAYCGITLPVCKETEEILRSLLRSPERVLHDVPEATRTLARATFLEEIQKGLKQFQD